MPISQDLVGRKAVVTGGASGLGFAISERLAASGASVTVVDLDTALSNYSGVHRSFACDLGKPDAKSRLAILADELRTVDIVVANAGVVPPWKRVRALEAEEWSQVMAVNVWGVAATIGAFADGLARSNNGSVIVMASINGYRAHPDQVLYSASKHAAIGVMRSAAIDLGGDGTRVNALAPGAIATEALMGRVSARHSEGGPHPDDVMAALSAETALGRMATEHDVANVAHILASDASTGMTGTVFPVEAGLL